MPYIHVQVSGPADDSLAARVAGQAVELTSRLLGKDPQLTAVVVDFIEPGRWFIAGRPLGGASPRSYHWMVSITDETNTKREKAAYLAAVHAAMRELLGEVAEHSYVHIADLRASAYGFGGLTQEYRYQHAG
ncbi:tautomerase family protein [Methylibium rhizosphaerae]|jgi:4-oxalocrotonate tautomerase|uniref:tautomerase family protein n=1 Tax=Methylibium rhizosphaerae TaxID=2570323 RepID=UPI00112B13E4|nr:4-oxalocrotonate tautomerase [Methylibium rhizosphaerae]